MTLAAVVEQRFERTPDGAVWTMAPSSYEFWTRYLSAFEEVAVVARVRPVPSVPPTAARCDGPGVVFRPVPHYVGPTQYVRRRRAVDRALQCAIEDGDAVLLRVPGQLANRIEAFHLCRGRPYGVQVVGDPWDAFSAGAVRHALRAAFRRSFAASLRRQCRHAVVACYVTREALQRRYPCPGVSVSASDVFLPPEAFRPPRPASAGPALHLVTVASLAQPYKGVDTLLRALAVARADGVPLRLTIVGDGRLRPALERSSARLGLDGYVRFTGELAGPAAVREELDAADAFVLASLSEGLPRAMLEAMARGLPCIGTSVGGVVELLESPDRVPPGNVRALASALTDLSRDSGRRHRMACRNRDAAEEFRDEELRSRRERFYAELRTRTEEWLTSGVAA